MRNPVDLPAELFDKVVDYAAKSNDDVQSLCAFCLVDRQWYTTTSLRIYSKWTYDGDIYSFRSLWNFLRTVLHNSQVVGQVRTLDVRNWAFHTDPPPNEDVCLSQEDFDLVRDAVRKAGIQELESSIFEALRKADRRPLMALLLTSLPNLTTICAHVPEIDDFLAGVLKLGTASQVLAA